MVGNAVLVTIAILLGYLFWLMGELKFIAPYKGVLFRAYGNIALGWLGLVVPKCICCGLPDRTHVFLKDAGRKLWHVGIEANRSFIQVPRHDLDEEPF